MVPCAALEIRQHLLQNLAELKPENRRKTGGKPEENRRKTGGKPEENRNTALCTDQSGVMAPWPRLELDLELQQHKCEGQPSTQTFNW